MEDSTSVVSPKVSWGAAAGVLAAVVSAVLGALIVEPDSLGSMPKWLTLLLIAGGPVLVQALTAYTKTDPLRAAGDVPE